MNAVIPMSLGLALFLLSSSSVVVWLLPLVLFLITFIQGMRMYKKPHIKGTQRSCYSVITIYGTCNVISPR